MVINTSYRGTILNTESELVHETLPIADFVFAHGAGAGKDSSFMKNMSVLLEKRGIRVHRFNFDYMIQALSVNKRRPPSKMTVLRENFIDVLNELPLLRNSQLPLFIGGKSMGSRVACEIVGASKKAISGVIAYGYPFHPAKKPEKSRLETLVTVNQPCLVVQGESDALGCKAEIETFDMPNTIDIAFVPTANHDLKPLKRSGWTDVKALQFAADETLAFIERVL
jgi:predicted alpha/beta-hydrolase family hydrolase